MSTTPTNIYSKASYVDPDLIDELGDEVTTPGGTQPADDQQNGQGSTANKYNVLDCKYKSNLRTRPYTTHHTYPRIDQLRQLANLPVKLIPIRLDLEIEGVKLRDQFTWNMNETLMTPEYFAQLLADDLEFPYASYFVPQIADAIRKQVSEYAAAVEEDLIPVEKLKTIPQKTVALESSPPSKSLVEDALQTKQELHTNGGDGLLNKESEVSTTSAVDETGDALDDFSAYGDLRIVITLDLHVGVVYLRDRFEWPLFPTHSITPEHFARQLSADLGVGGEFVPMIAHAIREQVVNARLNYSQATEAAFWRSRPFRSEDFEFEWQPDLRILSDEDIDRINKEEDRNSRRLRRQRHQLGGRSARGRVAESTIPGTLQPNLPVFTHYPFPPPTLSIGYVGGLLSQQLQYQQQLQLQIQQLQKQQLLRQQQQANLVLAGYAPGSRGTSGTTPTAPPTGYKRGPYKRREPASDDRRKQDSYSRRQSGAAATPLNGRAELTRISDLQRKRLH
ncbi:hypothetical protein BDV3_005523 [Batrachochytrium dendrobatidis]|nr:Chromatin structure remodeling complex protein sfh1 [Batrachochytrium dendrobatidis]